MTSTKTTKFVGYIYDDHDGPQFYALDPDAPRGERALLLEDLAPADAVCWDRGPENRTVGRFRITIEFEPGDGND